MMAPVLNAWPVILFAKHAMAQSKITVYRVIVIIIEFLMGEIAYAW